jgi:hypothetical protein
MKHATAALLTLSCIWFVGGAQDQNTSGSGEKRNISGPTPEYCLRLEPLRPNFAPTEDVHVRGRITDETAAPFQHSPVELRRFTSQRKQVTLKKVLTDDDGNFDLGIVKRGSYRLLLSPNRGFKQPENVECEKAKDCSFNSTLIVNPTDLPTASCPIR